MSSSRSLLLATLCLPLAAQATPGLRRDAASIGLGCGSQGPLFTVMRTGPSVGYFGGVSALPDTSSTAPQEAGNGAPRWVQHEGSRGEIHLGIAFRLDDRWVLGAGIGYATTAYRYTYNPGAAPYPSTGQPPAPGPLSDDRVGLVAMVDLRLGTLWGLETVGGVNGIGLALTRRF